MPTNSALASHAGLVVVGGGPAALEAARSYRAHHGQGRVLLLSADEHPPYQRPPLSKDYLRGESDEADLPLEDEEFYRDQEIEVELATRIVGLDVDRHEVSGEDRRLTYGACVLAVGSVPSALPVTGGDHPEVRLLRSRTHATQLREAASAATSVIVVGSGFIGCEAACSLARGGREVVMVSQEERPQQSRLGPEAATRVAAWLHEDGVRVLGGVDVAAIEGGHTVKLKEGPALTGDLVLVAAGVHQDTGWVENAGVKCDGGLVLTDSSMRTSASDVYAAGDIALAHNDAAGRQLKVEHWGDAVRMGEVAGAAAAGADESWAQVPGFWSEIGDRTLKYAAWGDGHDETRLVNHDGDAFTVWFGRDGTLVGVLTHDHEDDYERGGRLVEQAAKFGEALLS
jgi:3-phenylpropionate/trans-cinnamate dioxygenase ferredoxin reductase subunit